MASEPLHQQVDAEAVLARMRRACAILEGFGSNDHKIIVRGFRYDPNQAWEVASDWLRFWIDQPWEVIGSGFGYFAGRPWRSLEDSPEGFRRWEAITETPTTL